MTTYKHYQKINNKVIDAIFTENENLFIAEKNEKIYITLNGHNIHILPSHACFFNTDKIKKMEKLAGMIPADNTDRDDGRILKYLYNIDRIVNRKKMTYSVYENSAQEKIYFNKKLIDEYPDNYIIYAAGGRYDLYYIIDISNNNYIGGILPIKYTEEAQQ